MKKIIFTVLAVAGCCYSLFKLKDLVLFLTAKQPRRE